MKRLMVVLGLFACIPAPAQTFINGNRVIAGTINACISNTGNDSYNCNLPVTEYRDGLRIQLKADVANVGSATVSVNGLAPKGIKKAVGGVTTDLVDNDIRAGQIIDLVYDGTNFQMQSTLGNLAATTSGDGVGVDQIQHESSNLAKRPTVNFMGAGVTCADNAASNRTDCSIPGGGSGNGNGSGLVVDTAGSGYFLPFGLPHGIASHGTSATTGPRYYQFVLPYTLTFDQIDTRINTAASSPANGMQMGIYDSSCNVIVKSTTQTGLNVTGRKSWPFVRTTLTPGVYHFAITTDDTAVQIIGGSTGTAVQELLNEGAASPRFFLGSQLPTGSGSSLDLPASCGTKTAQNYVQPYVALLP